MEFLLYMYIIYRIPKWDNTFEFRLWLQYPYDKSKKFRWEPKPVGQIIISYIENFIL